MLGVAAGVVRADLSGGLGDAAERIERLVISFKQGMIPPGPEKTLNTASASRMTLDRDVSAERGELDGESICEPLPVCRLKSL